jgi:uncharacterized DUF497 family protein
MYIDNFEWDDKNREHISYKNVQDFEAEKVFLFDKSIYLRGRENKYYAYGVTESGRYLFVVFVTKGKAAIRIITARDMEKKERVYYKKRR